MRQSYWVKALVCAALISISMSARSSERMEWLKSLKPGILVPGGKGRPGTNPDFRV